MTVGNQASVAGVNGTLSGLAVQLRELMTTIQQQHQFLNDIGVTGLENLGGTGLGFSSADAASVLSFANNMSTVAGVYFGTVQQGGSGGTGASLFNFDNALTPLWGGQ